MKVNVWNTILQLSKERGVKTSIIIQAIEESLRVASSKFFTHNEKIHIDFRPEKGELRVYTVKKVTDPVRNPGEEISLEEARKVHALASQGEVIEIDLPSDTLGRIAAQAAKQVIFQKVRDAEQEKIYEEFAPRLGEIVTGIFRRIENNNLILEVNKTDVVLPERERISGDKFKLGDRVKAVILQVQKGNKGPQVVVSRANPKFLAKLLELETPEIANGNIEIKDIVRQPGERAKVAVSSNEKDVDPIGACIGVKGNRILAITKELGGEKVDVIEWSSNPLAYAKSALNPAKVEKLFILDRDQKIMEALFSRDQISLAIGKQGINVRLASKLVGWKIKIQQI